MLPLKVYVFSEQGYQTPIKTNGPGDPAIQNMLGGSKAESEETPADTEEAGCAENEVTSHESHDRG